ncbi:MAG: GNAT family N-acetyltransferase [Phycisphaerae bacterium]|nr:GNAT family N-acetyltransferase [Phycisphaerae bacterium]
MALKPGRTNARPTAPYRLEPFDPSQAVLVASWVCDAHEAYWLAPKTAPPVTADDVRAWSRPGYEQLQLVPARGRIPIAYGELNVLDSRRGLYWLGHLLVAPQRRRCGVGAALTSALLNRAFSNYAAAAVTLVVFPDNAPARACYYRAGLREDGWEVHYLPPYQRRVRLLRMSIKRPVPAPGPNF